MSSIYYVQAVRIDLQELPYAKYRLDDCGCCKIEMYRSTTKYRRKIRR